MDKNCFTCSNFTKCCPINKFQENCDGWVPIKTISRMQEEE